MVMGGISGKLTVWPLEASQVLGAMEVRVTCNAVATDISKTSEDIRKALRQEMKIKKLPTKNAIQESGENGPF